MGPTLCPSSETLTSLRLADWVRDPGAMKVPSRAKSGNGAVAVYEVTLADREKLRRDVAGLRRPIRKRSITERP
jgi:hypothetical protein